MNLEASTVEVLYEYVISNWMFLLPLAAFLYLLPTVVEPLSFGIAGFIVGSQFVLPFLRWLLTVVPLPVEPLVESIESAPLLWSIGVGVITAGVLYGLYKSVLFLGAAILTFLAVNMVLNALDVARLLNLPEYGIMLIALVVAIVAGAVTSKKSGVFVALISVAISSFVLSIMFTHVVSNRFANLGADLKLWVSFIAMLVLFFGRLTLLWRKKE